MQGLTLSFINRLHRTLKSKYEQVMAFCLLMTITTSASAGSDSTFSTIVDFFTNLLSGSLGVMLGIIALVIAIISVLAGQLRAFMFVLVIIVGAVFGPPIVMGFFTAIF